MRIFGISGRFWYSWSDFEVHNMHIEPISNTFVFFLFLFFGIRKKKLKKKNAYFRSPLVCCWFNNENRDFICGFLESGDDFFQFRAVFSSIFSVFFAHFPTKIDKFHEFR
jgi:hypothetical protein